MVIIMTIVMMIVTIMVNTLRRVRLDVSLDPLRGFHRPRIFTHRLVIFCAIFVIFGHHHGDHHYGEHAQHHLSRAADLSSLALISRVSVLK